MSSIPAVRPAYDTQETWAWHCLGIGERIFSLALLVILGPALALIWITMLALSGCTPLIAHRRVGRNGSELWVLKFRTMWEPGTPFDGHGACVVEYIDDEAGPAMKRDEDPRVQSRFARFCRRHSLDELPQLIHVLSGKMSLVGPRPVTRAELEEIYGSHAGEVLGAKPGLSGLWQISGRNRLTTEERCRLDLRCARSLTVRLYFHILWRTIPEVFSGAGAW